MFARYCAINRLSRQQVIHTRTRFLAGMPAYFADILKGRRLGSIDVKIYSEVDDLVWLDDYLFVFNERTNRTPF